MTKLSVNINKIATLRNARGGNVPNLLQVAKDIQQFGAQGITIHPRPDERHIRYQDARELKSIVYTEYNIEIPLMDWNKQHFIRVSYQGYNTEEDMEKLIGALQQALQIGN